MPRLSQADWAVIGLYFGAMALIGALLSRRASRSARDYFLASGDVPPWLAAISVLATTQSAATFLGGPDAAFRGDLTYLMTSLGGLLAAFVVAQVFIPRFYREGVTTVYELLRVRFGAPAMHAAGAMFLVGRVLAGGARLYLAAVAVAMLAFGAVGLPQVAVSALVLILLATVFAFHGGLRSIVWLDLLQFVVYAGAAVGLLLFLRAKIPVPTHDLLAMLRHGPGGHDKLKLLDLSLNPSSAFSVPAICIGYTLLMIGNFALDQDTTQRLLACRDARGGATGVYLSVLFAAPVVALFLAIGELLWVFYASPSAAAHAEARAAGGSDATIFMRFILTQVPAGLRGLATAGVMATAVGTTMSALNAMSSVLIQDFYRPWKVRRLPAPEGHFVAAGRAAMVGLGLATAAVALLSYLWQSYADTPLLEFVLSVMNFTYAGLLGVYFVALFTNRGSTASVISALIAGFVVILVLQPYCADALQLPKMFRRLAFTWQLVIGAGVSFLVCSVGDRRTSPAASLVDSGSPRNVY